MTTGLTSVNTWTQVTDSGVLPVGADEADIVISGTVPISTGEEADVVWDDVEFTINCVVDYAKVSGRIGRSGKGKSPSHTFGGSVGVLEDGTIIGEINVNYKVLGEQCTYTAGGSGTFSIEQSGTRLVLNNWENSCDDPANTYDLRIIDNSVAAGTVGAPLYCVNTTGRGCFGISEVGGGGSMVYRVDDSMTIDDDSPSNTDNANLERGNAQVFED